MKKLILLFLFLPISVFASISEKTLTNGMRIIVKVDNRSPIFISQLWYKVGSNDENINKTGIAHLLEHLMFKATKNLKSGEFSKIIAKNGGSDNAFTSYDYTAYYQKMHKSKLALALQMEADRMQNLQFSNKEFTKELLVVIEERRLRVEDNPHAQVWEKFNKTSFKGIYQAPIIGYQQDLKNLKLQDAKDWYIKYYHPNNATLVVVGDVIPANIFLLAEKYFGIYPAKNINSQQKQTKFINNKHQVLKIAAKLPYGIIAFKVPNINSAKNKKDIYSLKMLSYLLDDLIEKHLIRDRQVLSSVSTSYDIYDKYDNLFTISFITNDGYSFTDAKQEIFRQIDKITNNKNLDYELKKLAIQLRSSFVYAQDDISHIAYNLGKLASNGIDISILQNYPQLLSKITTADIQQVIKKYLLNLNSIELIPQ